MKEAIIIAEIGCNHKGDIAIAKELIKTAKEYCHANVAKFQKRNNKELLTKEQYNAPHPNPMHAYGSTYGEHREFLEFTADQHAQLKSYCEQVGIEYSTSVWDLTSAQEMASINPSFLKIPSACNNNYKMLEWLCKNYKGEIHVSTGMTTKQETDDLISFFKKQNRHKDVVLYHCTSGYPVAFEDICLLEIKTLREKYANEIKDIGFSGHHLGIAADIAAYALGANYMERHFTLDRTWKGTDHSASLEPDGMRKLCRDLKAIHKAMHYKEKDILDVEEVQRKKLKYRPA